MKCVSICYSYWTWTFHIALNMINWCKKLSKQTGTRKLMLHLRLAFTIIITQSKWFFCFIKWPLNLVQDILLLLMLDCSLCTSWWGTIQVWMRTLTQWQPGISGIHFIVMYEILYIIMHGSISIVMLLCYRIGYSLLLLLDTLCCNELDTFCCNVLDTLCCNVLDILCCNVLDTLCCNVGEHSLLQCIGYSLLQCIWYSLLQSRWALSVVI